MTLFVIILCCACANIRIKVVHYGPKKFMNQGVDLSAATSSLSGLGHSFHHRWTSHIIKLHGVCGSTVTTLPPSKPLVTCSINNILYKFYNTNSNLTIGQNNNCLRNNYCFCNVVAGRWVVVVGLHESFMDTHPDLMASLINSPSILRKENT